MSEDGSYVDNSLDADDRNLSVMYLVPNRIKFPRLTKAQLADAINQGIVSQDKAAKMIKDPNKYTVLLQKIDAQDPLIKQLLLKYQIQPSQIEIVSFKEYYSNYKPEFGERIASNEYLHKIAKVVDYLQYLSQQYEYVKMIVKNKNQMFQQIKWQQQQDSVMNQSVNSKQHSSDDSVIRNYRPKYFRLDEALDNDQQKVDFQVANLARYLDIQRETKKSQELFIQNLNETTQKHAVNKQKQLKDVQLKMQSEFQKVKQAQETHKEIKKKRKQELNDYYKQQKKKENKKDIYLRVEEERRSQASLISSLQMSRTSYMKGVSDFKNNQELLLQTKSTRYIENKEMDIFKKRAIKKQNQVGYIQKLKEHNEYQVENNYQKSMQLEKKRHDEFEDRLVYQKGLKSKKYMLEFVENMRKMSKEKLKERLSLEEKVRDNQKQLEKRDRSEQQQKLKKMKIDVEQKEKNHECYLKQMQDKIFQETSKRQGWLDKNQKVIRKRDNLRYDRLDDKNHSLIVNRNMSNSEQDYLQEVRLQQRHFMIRNKEERDRMLEMINRNPLG